MEAPMKIALDCSLKIDIEKGTLKEILSVVPIMITDFLGQFVYATLLAFVERDLLQVESRFVCHQCGSRSHFHWKTRAGRTTSLLTLFGKISFPELQLYCGCCKARKVVSREVLEVEARAKIPTQTVRSLALIGSLATYGVSQIIAKTFGVVLQKMTVWRCVQKVGKTIEFDLDPSELSVGEADGTGIPIRGILKRGREVKVFVQLKKWGGCRVAGASIGKYETGWDQLFKPLISQLKKMKNFLLITDGDTSILKGLGDKIEILFQRCLWHIPHQFKWYGWKDEVDKKGVVWLNALAQLIDIIDTSCLCLDDESCLPELLKIKKQRYSELIEFCRAQKWESTAVYLANAEPDLFRGVENKLENKTQSHVERLWRTMKLRTHVGKWEEKSALNLIKIRLAFYYNGWTA